MHGGEGGLSCQVMAASAQWKRSARRSRRRLYVITGGGVSADPEMFTRQIHEFQIQNRSNFQVSEFEPHSNIQSRLWTPEIRVAYSNL